VDSAGDYTEDTCVNIQEYEMCCYLVFCYYNNIVHKTSEMTYINRYIYEVAVIAKQSVVQSRHTYASLSIAGLTFVDKKLSQLILPSCH